MNAGTDQSDVTAGNACWQTPPAVFNALHETYSFDVDLCADSRRRLLPVFFGPGSAYGADALTTPWHQFGEWGFCNPPYGKFIKRILDKAFEEACFGFSTVLLLPLRLTKAVREAIFVTESVSDWLFPDKRITFYENGKPRLSAKTGEPMPAMFDSTILIMRPGVFERPTINQWAVPEHV